MSAMSPLPERILYGAECMVPSTAGINAGSSHVVGARPHGHVSSRSRRSFWSSPRQLVFSATEVRSSRGPGRLASRCLTTAAFAVPRARGISPNSVIVARMATISGWSFSRTLLTDLAISWRHPLALVISSALTAFFRSGFIAVSSRGGIGSHRTSLSTTRPP